MPLECDILNIALLTHLERRSIIDPQTMGKMFRRTRVVKFKTNEIHLGGQIIVDSTENEKDA